MRQKGKSAMILLKKILVATDFSEPSDAALVYGRELARNFGAQLVVLHVADNLAARAYGADGFVAVEPDLQEQVEESARRRVAALLSDEDRDILRAQGIVFSASSTALSIVEYARESNTDLIVLGTHGRGGVAHLLL